MNAIFEQFNAILPISEKKIVEITPSLKTKTMLKGEFLLKENQVCDSMAFITKGSFRSFHINPNGSSVNLMLNSSNDFISNYESYISKSPSNISIQAIEKSEVILIQKRNLDQLLENSFYWNKLARLLTENIFITAKLRLESMIYKTPEERYLDLLTKNPEFLEKYSLTDISCFIGVTLQSLSRIRARI